MCIEQIAITTNDLMCAHTLYRIGLIGMYGRLCVTVYLLAFSDAVLIADMAGHLTFDTDIRIVRRLGRIEWVAPTAVALLANPTFI